VLQPQCNRRWRTSLSSIEANDPWVGVSRLGLWGFGREGAAVLELARARGVDDVVVYSTGTEKLPDGVVRAGSSNELGDVDLVVRSPGVPIYAADYRVVADQVATSTLTNLWMQRHGSRTIAVAGTKGKSTVTTLAVALFHACGIDAKIGGNVGVPLYPDDHVSERQWVVAELSSFQISDLTWFPALAVLTSFHPEHLDWHRSLENYRRDKLRLLSGVDAESRVAIGAFGAAEALQALDLAWPQPVSDMSGTQLFVDGDVVADIAGSYLDDNVGIVSAQLALEVLIRAGVDVVQYGDAISDAMVRFRGLPHRRQIICQTNSIIAVDDTLATTPIAAARTIDEYDGRTVAAIVGGGDRGLDFGPLIAKLTSRFGTTHAICVPDTGTDRVGPHLNENEVNVVHADNIEQAVDHAVELLTADPSGGVILLSPASPSHNRYANYRELGERFKQQCELRLGT